MSSMDDAMILLMDEKRKVTAVLHIVISNTFIYIYIYMSPPTLDGREDATSRRVRTFFPPPYFLSMPTYLAREKNNDTGQKNWKKRSK